MSMSALPRLVASAGVGVSSAMMSPLARPRVVVASTLSRRHRAAMAAASARCSYFTNADRMKRDDPYAALGLTWGATSTEIKEAFRRRARELHPDVNGADSPEEALRKFQEVQRAYQKLMDVRGAPHRHRDDLAEEWSFAVWRNGDIIAQERTDVAGEAVKRPAKPAAAQNGGQWGVAALGHPDGGGNARRRAEYLGDGGKAGPRSSTVGTGQSKWVTPKEFKPWNPEDVKVKAVGRTRARASVETMTGNGE